jgi:hypothetical protein
MRKKAIPKYRRQTDKSGDHAFVMLDGKRYYLGEYGSPESKEQYRRLIAEWTLNSGFLHKRVVLFRQMSKSMFFSR